MQKSLNTLNKFIRYFSKGVELLATKGYLHWMNDRTYIKLLYKGYFGHNPNLKNPSTYNEKLQWLKLHDHNPLYTQLVDKYRVREYVQDKIGKEYLIPLLGVWDNPEQIVFSELPNQFVLKCNHDTGSVIVCKNKQTFDSKDAKAKLRRCLANGTYWYTREWPYKNVRPCVIAEEYMEDDTYHELRDYKFFCFDGLPKAMYVATGRMNPDAPTSFDFFDMNYNHLAIKQGHPNAKVTPDKPHNFEKMKELAKILSEGLPHVRVDFYEINNKVYFGEMTFYHMGGVYPFVPDCWDKTFGDWLNLPSISLKKEVKL